MPNVLILCTGNSCRSQMAEVIWNHLGASAPNEAWTAKSAGSKPSGYVHPLAIRALQELDLPVVGLVSKTMDSLSEESFDLAITVCGNAKESCPVISNANKVLHWPYDDPADAEGDDDEKMKVFRRVRDEIHQAISQFLQHNQSYD